MGDMTLIFIMSDLDLALEDLDFGLSDLDLGINDSDCGLLHGHLLLLDEVEGLQNSEGDWLGITDRLNNGNYAINNTEAWWDDFDVHQVENDDELDNFDHLLMNPTLAWIEGEIEGSVVINAERWGRRRQSRWFSVGKCQIW